mmetsp:Transcript_34844/g.74274  ORF Transcript_34844/g.74274 Transcript_34844/m.74274 type:complete len:535 (-) Transcript_34844:68-1672(-)
MHRKLPVFCLTALLSSNGAFTVQALATPAARRKGRKSKLPSGGGFAKAKVKVVDQKQEAEAASEALAKRTVSNLFSVCAHIQDPQLYQPKWADACTQKQNDQGDKNAVVATRDVTRGQVLTLFPIHSLGLRTLSQNTKKGKKKSRDSDTEFVAYDRDVDGELFRQDDDQQAGLRMRFNIPLDDAQPAYTVLGNRKHNVLFSTFFPVKKVIPGWLGGRMKAASLSAEPNCITMPLPGAAPLCAVVATKDVKEGEEIIQSMQPMKPNIMDELKLNLANEYSRDLSSLQMHIEMACEIQIAQLESAAGTNIGDSSTQLGPFHELNRKYPGLMRIHKDPDIYSIENFLTGDECARVIAKSKPHLTPCLVQNEKSGKAEQDRVRTSTNANIPQAEVPTIVQKMTDMACCNADQLEILQVLNYKKDQEFIPHTDGFSGKFDACGFEQSSRQATIFCYLNDVAVGGATYFPEIDLEIQPRKGTAIIHFPADLKLREDTRTLHQGSPAVDEKWLLTTWVWNKGRSDEMYAEKKLCSLSSDII